MEDNKMGKEREYGGEGEGTRRGGEGRGGEGFVSYRLWCTTN